MTVDILAVPEVGRATRHSNAIGQTCGQGPVAGEERGRGAAAPAKSKGGNATARRAWATHAMGFGRVEGTRNGFAGIACRSEGGVSDGPGARPEHSGARGNDADGAHSDHAQMQKATRPSAASAMPIESARPEPVTTAVPRPKMARTAKRMASAAISGSAHFGHGVYLRRARDIGRPLRAIRPMIGKPLHGFSQSTRADIGRSGSDRSDPASAIQDQRRCSRLGDAPGGAKHVDSTQEVGQGAHGSGLCGLLSAPVNGSFSATDPIIMRSKIRS